MLNWLYNLIFGPAVKLQAIMIGKGGIIVGLYIYRDGAMIRAWIHPSVQGIEFRSETRYDIFPGRHQNKQFQRHMSNMARMAYLDEVEPYLVKTFGVEF